MRNTRLTSLVFVVVLGTTMLCAQTTSGTSNSHWTVVSSPNVSGQDNVLAAVAVNSSTDVWAVGQFIPDNNQDLTQTLTEHWNGTTWSVVPSPNVGSLANALFAVTAKSGEAWAVGYFINSNLKSKSLIEHWDGHSWTVVSHPNAGASDQLFGVSAVSPSDIWAVGIQRDSTGKFSTLTEHFNGSAWSIVSSPNPGSSGNQLLALVAVSSDSVWAVGQQTGSAGPDIPLIEHWNGTAWNVVTSPTDSVFSTQLFGVGAVSDDDVFGVGDKQDNINNPRTLAVNGVNGTFAFQSSSNVGSGENHLYGIAAASNDLAFAVGDSLNKAGNFLNLVERCTPSGCVQESTPNPSQGGSNQLGGIALVSATEAWAVGAFDGPNAPQTLILHRQ